MPMQSRLGGSAALNDSRVSTTDSLLQSEGRARHQTATKRGGSNLDILDGARVVAESFDEARITVEAREEL